MKRQMIATQEFSYGGKSLKAGDAFEAQDKDAFLLQGLGKARIEGDSEKNTAEKTKRRYRRRDMTAES
jgi:hypothetical protein